MSRLLVIDDVTARPPVPHTALGPALMRWIGDPASDDNDDGGGPPVDEAVRAWRPDPTMAFTGRDCVTPGIAEAVVAAERHGYVPVRRGPGGRAAGYDRGSLCLDHVGRTGPGTPDITGRFARFAHRFADALRALGVDAQVGAVPGEYCPGDWSVNDGAGHKLLGTAQRLTRAGWLFSSVVTVGPPDPVRAALVDVYAALGLDFAPATVGSVVDVVPGLRWDDAKEAFIAALGRDVDVQRTTEVPAAVLAEAAGTLEQFRVPVRVA
ncbi:lipoate--protein ligase family protein [Nakamurella leprariae]|uniref:Lipoate--protein ligase family protein n=1 Tax=Nakamurella leprariae TaxID=2803911 RepID=A0A938YIJ2_9ACTN|nr:lipoate--protein ligase family protein [Nakamurella leprariae]MBM9468425.1 lipoate--protein ligase family protein [Nakamurella leprariae]